MARNGREQWAIWQDVPDDYTGAWRATDAMDWTYYGGFVNGVLVCAHGLGPDVDPDTHAAWFALLELTMRGHEPRVPVVPIHPTRVLAFPMPHSRGA